MVKPTDRALTRALRVLTGNHHGIDRRLVRELIRELRVRYPGKSRSWVSRSLRRFLGGGVRALGGNAWVVRGEPSMGDRLPQYVVRLINGKYTCDCQAGPWGGSRGLCTHIGAVIASQVYEELMRTVYAAVIRVKCVDTELIIPGGGASVEKVVNGRETIYIVRTDGEKTLRALLACNDEIRELTIGTGPMKNWEIKEAIQGTGKTTREG